MLVANAGAEFEWDEANIEHLTRHEVSPNEVEQVILDPHALIVEMQSHPEEERFKAIGMTSAGRILVVVFTLHGAVIRPITSYEGSRRDQEMYLKQRGQ